MIILEHLILLGPNKLFPVVNIIFRTLIFEGLMRKKYLPRKFSTFISSIESIRTFENFS